MLTIKCSACSTALKLQNVPPAGKVKCPKCGAIVSVGAPKPVASKPVAPAAAAPKRASVGAGGLLDPDDEGFDFGKISFPSVSGVNAVTQFPKPGRVAVYEGPIPGDPLNIVVEPEDEDDLPTAHGAAPQRSQAAKAAPQPSSGTKKRNPKILIAAIAGLLLLVVVGVAAAVMLGGGGSGPQVDLAATLQSTAPSGFKAVGIDGCVILMPKGFDYPDLPSNSEVAAVESEASGSVYLLAAMNGGSRPLDQDQMIKKARRQLGGDILGGTEMERNGYKGYKGMLDGSLFLPRMMVEIFHVDERFVIVGCAPKSMGADPSVEVDRAKEGEEQAVFYGSFKVGPKPSGWLW
jgi:hypothetical protein